MVSSAYLMLLIFLLAILIPACASSSPAFHMMYSAYKSSKQGDSIQPWHTPFPIWNQSVVLCPVVTCFLTRIQISQEAGKVFWYSHLFENFPQFPRGRERLILRNLLTTVAAWLCFINSSPSIMILVHYHSRAGIPDYPLQWPCIGAVVFL